MFLANSSQYLAKSTMRVTERLTQPWLSSQWYVFGDDVLLSFNG